MTYPIGMVVSIGNSINGEPSGTRGVILEHYGLDKICGVSILFPNGKFDSFSECCLEYFDISPAYMAHHLQNYHYESDDVLKRDFEKGLFSSALNASFKRLIKK